MIVGSRRCPGICWRNTFLGAGLWLKPRWALPGSFEPFFFNILLVFQFAGAWGRGFVGVCQCCRNVGTTVITKVGRGVRVSGRESWIHAENRQMDEMATVLQ